MDGGMDVSPERRSPSPLRPPPPFQGQTPGTFTGRIRSAQQARMPLSGASTVLVMKRRGNNPVIPPYRRHTLCYFSPEAP